MSSKRNAFLMLFSCDQERAVRYLRSIINNVHTTGDTFQLAILNLLRKLARNNPKEKGKYLRVITNLIESPSAAVLYQCAGTLVSLTTNQVAIKAAAECYIKLLLTVSIRL
jgi:coatomer subunit beta